VQKTLIYIIGAGRSGTTVLDIMLGNVNGSISLGEINRFFKRNGIPPKREKESKVYNFWINLKDQMIGSGFNDMLYLQKLSQQNEYHLAFVKSLFKKCNSEYVNAIVEQYGYIGQNTSQNVLIESSKYPVRALNLSNYLDRDQFQIKYIYLKKDPEKVVKSFQKKNLEQPSKGFLMANLYYLIVNILCGITIRILKIKGHRVGTLRYEDLISTPKETLLKLGSDIDEDYSELMRKLIIKEPLNTGYVFDGNRIRLKETLILRDSDTKEKTKGKLSFTRIFNYIVYR
jgi:hypothetical protein